MSQKLLEYKNVDWLKGISSQINVPIGGLFQSLEGCDPFEQGGLALPSRQPATQALGTTPKVLTSFNNGGNNYLYAHSDTTLSQVLQVSPYTVTDETAQVYQHVTSGMPDKILNAIIYQGSYVYAAHTTTPLIEWYANSLPVNSSNDVLIKTGAPHSDDVDYMPMGIGQDGNLYCGNGNAIAEITSVAGTSGNAAVFYIDTGFTIRDIKNDGRYLVIFADNNALLNSGRLAGAYKVKVYFWDMVQSDANSRIIPDVMWDLDDSYVIGAQLLENAFIMFTYNGIYATTSGTYPKLLRPFPSNTSLLARPLNPSQIGVKKGSIFWVDGFSTANADVYAYGNPITGQQKIFYRPYVGAANVLASSLLPVGDEIVKGDSTPQLSFFNVSGQARGSLNVISLDTNMESPVRYDFTKVVLSQKLSSGQTVTVNVLGNGGNDQISAETQSYNSAKPKQTLKFNRNPTTTNQPDRFEDIQITIATTGGAALQRVAVYGTPNDDATADL